MIVHKLNKQIGELQSALTKCQGERDALNKIVDCVYDEKQTIHPDWITKSKEEVLEAFKFQGAMTKVLLRQEKEYWDKITSLEALADKLVEAGKIGHNTDCQLERMSNPDKCFCLADTHNTHLQNIRNGK